MQYTYNILDILVTISYNIQQRLHIAPQGWDLDCCWFFLHRFNAITGPSSVLRFVAHSILYYDNVEA